MSSGGSFGGEIVACGCGCIRVRAVLGGTTNAVAAAMKDAQSIGTKRRICTMMNSWFVYFAGFPSKAMKKDDSDGRNAAKQC